MAHLARLLAGALLLASIPFSAPEAAAPEKPAANAEPSTGGAVQAAACTRPAGWSRSDMAIDKKGTGAAGRAAAADHAINSKGTGASGRIRPAGGGDCDEDCDGVTGSSSSSTSARPACTVTSTGAVKK
jgi:hypothetical protein